MTPALKPILSYYNVSKRGPPANKNITRVPSLITKEGQIFVGAEVKKWLESMIPCDFTEWDGVGIKVSNLDDSESEGNFFSLDSYGVSLSPMMTPSIKAKLEAGANPTKPPDYRSQI